MSIRSYISNLFGSPNTAEKNQKPVSVDELSEAPVFHVQAPKKTTEVNPHPTKKTQVRSEMKNQSPKKKPNANARQIKHGKGKGKGKGGQNNNKENVYASSEFFTQYNKKRSNHTMHVQLRKADGEESLYETLNDLNLGATAANHPNNKVSHRSTMENQNPKKETQKQGTSAKENNGINSVDYGTASKFSGIRPVGFKHIQHVKVGDLLSYDNENLYATLDEMDLKKSQEVINDLYDQVSPEALGTVESSDVWIDPDNIDSEHVEMGPTPDNQTEEFQTNSNDDLSTKSAKHPVSKGTHVNKLVEHFKGDDKKENQADNQAQARSEMSDKIRNLIACFENSSGHSNVDMTDENNNEQQNHAQKNSNNMTP